MLRTHMTMAALFAALSAGSAMASETHEVTIHDNDFMPPLVFAAPGDVIRFINDDEGDHQVSAADDSWETLVLAPDTYIDVTVTPEMILDYQLDETLFLEAQEEVGTETDVTEGGEESGTAVTDESEGEVTFEELDLSNS